MERFCLDCNLPLRGRADKKFCDDNCRTHYHNQLKSENSLIFKKINKILNRNRSILSRFSPKGKARLNLKKLQDAGFHFGYFTHMHHTQNGHSYFFCYEYGYLHLKEDEYLIVRKDD